MTLGTLLDALQPTVKCTVNERVFETADEIPRSKWEEDVLEIVVTGNDELTIITD